MARLLAAALACACLCVAGGSANAQDDDETGGGGANAQDDGEENGSDYARTGWYVGAFGSAMLNAYRTAGSYDDSGGFDARFGYREREWLALEAELEWTHFDGSIFGTPADTDTIIGGVNAKLFPMLGRYQPYGLIGVNGMGVIVDRSAGIKDFGGTDWAFRFGAGIDVYATRNIVVAFEGTYVWGVGDVWDLDYGTVGLGVLYRF
jgi:opacity protein-like surface antigen